MAKRARPAPSPSFFDDPVERTHPDTSAAAGPTLPPKTSGRAAALVTSRAEHFSRSGFRFTKIPRLVRLKDIGEERWSRILTEGDRFLSVELIPEDEAKAWEDRQDHPAPAEIEATALRAEIQRLKSENENLRRENVLQRNRKSRFL